MEDARQGAVPVRISTIRKSDDHRSDALIGVDTLAPDHDIVGRLGHAVATLVRNDADLKGQEPHLANAIEGVFARVAYRHTSEQADGVSSRINWNPTHDLEVATGTSAQ